jgi:hypothetical protein
MEESKAEPAFELKPENKPNANNASISIAALGEDDSEE